MERRTANGSQEAGADARVGTERVGDELIVTVGGTWRLVDEIPEWDSVVRGSNGAKAVRVQVDGLETWDSSLLVFLERARRWCADEDKELTTDGLPPQLEDMLDRVESTGAKAKSATTRSQGGLAAAVQARVRGLLQALAFVGELVFAVVATCANPRRFPWRDWIVQMRICGANALPIVGLITFLVGAIVAYQAAIQLRKFGADLYIADLVSLSITREMGPVMAAIVIAGRTGSAFAAELGKMVASDEIDAFRAIGVSPVAHLALPRVAALIPMLPILTLYGDALGILGGAVISSTTLDVPLAAFWVETGKALEATDVATGLIKSVVFGVLVGAVGCLRGLQADRSSAGVGAAATSAAVSGILLIIVADAIFGEIFNSLGI